MNCAPTPGILSLIIGIISLGYFIYYYHLSEYISIPYARLRGRWGGLAGLGGVAQGVEGVDQEALAGLGGVGEVPQKLVITQQTPSQGPVRTLPQPNQGMPPQGLEPQGMPPTLTLTPEEVGALADHSITYQNGRWVHTELTPTARARQSR